MVLTSLFGSSINFIEANKNPKRVHPSSSTQIVSYSETIEKAMRSVVNISTTQKVNIKNSNRMLSNDPFFRDFFEQFYGRGNNRAQESIQRSLGSGVIVSKDGYIITNFHVINNADKISVTLSNSAKEYKATLIGSDEGSDIAVIKIDARGIMPIKFANSSNLHLGDVVFAIGNPFGVGQSVSSGIISALNKNRVGINRYENFIQTDASINPGNSGGALIDSRGALIGINSAILTKSGGNNGIGFAIPVDMVKNIVTKLVVDGKVIRGYLGVSIKDLSKDLKEVYRSKIGAVVLDIEKDSPAYHYGLQRGDLILKINSKVIKNSTSLQSIVASFNPNEKVTIQIERNKRFKIIKLVLSSRDKNIIKAIKNSTLNGLELSNLTPQVRQQFRITNNIDGVLIKNVKPNSEAEKNGIQAGDVIIQIEDKLVSNFNGLNKALKIYKKVPKRFFINRYGHILIFVLR